MVLKLKAKYYIGNNYFNTKGCPIFLAAKDAGLPVDSVGGLAVWLNNGDTLLIKSRFDGMLFNDDLEQAKEVDGETIIREIEIADME